MLAVRRDKEIYQKDGGWFRARWHFSFDEYRDLRQMGVGALRVFNDDRLAAGAAWPMHPHRDIESLTYVVEGRFAHADSLDNGGQLGPGGAQVMDFGHAGAFHSERNASQTEPLRFIQFWILPSEPEMPTGLRQRQHTVEDRTDRWLQIMGPPGESGLDLAQDARVRVSRLSAGAELDHRLGDARGGYLYLIEGEIDAGDERLATGDAAEIEGPHELSMTAVGHSEIMLVDVPLRYRPVGVWAAGGS